MDVAPDSLNGPGGTVSTATVVPDQVRYHLLLVAGFLIAESNKFINY